MTTDTESIEKASKIFTDAWNSYSELRLKIDKNYEISVFGAEAHWEYDQRLFVVNVLKHFERGLGMTSMHGPVRGAIITPDTVESEGRAYADQASLSVTPIREALTLVIAHAVFETLVIQLGLSLLEVIPDSQLKHCYGAKTLSINEVMDGWQNSVRNRVSEELRERMTLKNRISFILSGARSLNPEECDRLCEAYNVNVDQIVSIDGRRQDVLHGVTIAPEYRFQADGDILASVARLLGHLVANCALGQGLAYISYAFSANGPEVIAGTEPRREFPPITWKDFLALISYTNAQPSKTEDKSGTEPPK